MENENEVKEEIKKENKLPPISSIVIVVSLVLGAYVYTIRLKDKETLWHPARLNQQQQSEASLRGGVELPVKWDNLGVQMIDAGVIDKTKFESLYAGRGGLSEADQKLLSSGNNGNLVINSENSGVMLNMLWAFGLANKNPIIENGPMMDKQYGGAGNFASTGGWTLAKGNAMDHYSMHSFVTLTPEQQALVERVAKNIYRPCCDNSTYFPDCNHGMAMLGLLELMASQKATETDMYKTALGVNTLWFPSQYEAIKTFFVSQNMDWNTTDPRKILSAEFSSASGYQKVLSQIQPPEQKGGASCGA